MNRLKIVMYHYVRDLSNSRYPDIKGLDYKLFQDQIAFLVKHFNPVKIEDVIAAYDENKPDALPENAVLLTFDDGYIDNYTYAFPILDEYKVQGTFFIPGKTFRENVLLDVNKIHFILASGSISNIIKDVISEIIAARKDHPEIPDIEILLNDYAIANRFDAKETVFVKRMLQTALPENLRNEISSKLFLKYVGMPEDQFAKELYMNEEQIKTMGRHGMHIGLHGYDHYWLGNLPIEEAEKDICRSIDSMKGIIKEDSWVFNYPYGNYNDSVVSCLARHGCKLAMTTEVREADLQKDGRLLLPRLDTNAFPPKSNNYIKFS